LCRGCTTGANPPFLGAARTARAHEKSPRTLPWAGFAGAALRADQ